MTEQPSHPITADPWAGAWDRCSRELCECNWDNNAMSTPLTDPADME